MSEQVQRKGAPGDPITGSAVALVPVGDARLLTGTLLRWETPAPGSPVGTPVTLTVDISPTNARGGAFPVWATVLAAGGDSLVVSAEATPTETSTVVSLTGSVAVREPRRRNVRAAAHVDVDLTVKGIAGRIAGRTLDLSAGGCRVALDTGEQELPAMREGESTDIVIHLDRANRPQMSGHVHAVRPGGQIVIRFDSVPQPVAEQIERYVYATLP
ncbi:PilZ domain-containing protein [Motilibacter peucedani]|uniref:PilZ domain-containing protein n=1 Tax=Motilibacter peucedani TaxID=598650 RepID=A0A420XK89_9ACTN|nr:PilZ domain-containing protein [Motilibacter peucedani]RKS68040.1 PilZ domain-containing protein [Motilibacter peucedani]